MKVNYSTRIETARDVVVVTTEHEAEELAAIVGIRVGEYIMSLNAETAEALSNALRAHVNRRFM